MAADSSDGEMFRQNSEWSNVYSDESSADSDDADYRRSQKIKNSRPRVVPMDDPDSEEEKYVPTNQEKIIDGLADNIVDYLLDQVSEYDMERSKILDYARTILDIIINWIEDPAIKKRQYSLKRKEYVLAKNVYINMREEIEGASGLTFGKKNLLEIAKVVERLLTISRVKEHYDKKFIVIYGESEEEFDENAILISMIAEDVHKYLMKRIKKKARIATADSFDFAERVVSEVKDIISNEREDRNSQIQESRGARPRRKDSDDDEY